MLHPFFFTEKDISTIISRLHILECPPIKYGQLNYWIKANHSSKLQLRVKQDRYQHPKQSHCSQDCITEESPCSSKPRQASKYAGLRK